MGYSLKSNGLDALVHNLEPLTDSDFEYLAELADRRGHSPIVYADGLVQQQGNFTLAVLVLRNRPAPLPDVTGFGMSKRNPNCDEPDSLRGRRIALARAYFDLLQADGMTLPIKGK